MLPALRSPYLWLTMAGIGWGLGFTFGKIALDSMPVFAMVTLRFLVASLALLPVLIFAKQRPTRSQVMWLVITGVLYVPLQFIVQFEGLARTSVSHASLVVASIPAMLAVAGAVFARGRNVAWLAVAASIVGAAIIVMRPDGGASITGDLLVLASLFASVAWVLLTERFLRGMQPALAAAYAIWFGTIAMAVWEIAANPQQLFAPYPFNAWLAVIAAGIVSTVLSTVLWNAALQRVPSSDAGVFINLEPLVGALSGVLVFGNPATLSLLAGGGLIVASAIWIARSG